MEQFGLMDIKGTYQESFRFSFTLIARKREMISSEKKLEKVYIKGSSL